MKKKMFAALMISAVLMTGCNVTPAEMTTDTGVEFAAFAGYDREAEIKGLLLVEPALVIGEELMVTYEDGTDETLRIYALLSDCNLHTVIYMGTHDGYGDDPTSFDQALEVLPSGELVIIEGSDHFFEGEYGDKMVEDSCGKTGSRNA